MTDNIVHLARALDAQGDAAPEPQIGFGERVVWQMQLRDAERSAAAWRWRCILFCALFWGQLLIGWWA